MYAIVENGKFTGVVYAEVTKAVKNHADKYNLKLVEVETAPINKAKEGEPADYGAPPPYTPEQQAQALIKAVATEIERRLNALANANEFDTITTALTRVNSPDAIMKAQALVCAKADAKLWRWSRDYREGVQNGTIPMPTSAEEVIAQIPAIE